MLELNNVLVDVAVWGVYSCGEHGALGNRGGMKEEKRFWWLGKVGGC